MRMRDRVRGRDPACAAGGLGQETGPSVFSDRGGLATNMARELVESIGAGLHKNRPQAPAKLCAAFATGWPQPELQALVGCMVQALGLPAGQLQIVTGLPGGVMAGPGCGISAALAGDGRPKLHAVCAGEVYGNLDTRQVVAANDRLGFSPLYYLLRDDFLLLASEARAIAAVTDVHLDPAGAGQFFYIGHMLRHQTLWREIKALGPGQLIEWQPGGGAVRTYYDMARRPATGASPASLGEIHDALHSAVARATRPDSQDTLLLSGGLDSRLILGVLLSQGRKPRALTLEHAGFAQGLDGLLARQVASIAGLELDFRPTRPQFYRSADALDVFCIADGMTPSFGLFISQVYPELAPNQGRVWEGLALDLCLGGHHQTGATLRSNLPELLASRRANRRFLQQFLQHDWFELIESSFGQELEQELACFPDTEDGWIRFQMANRKRRRVGLPPHQLYARKALALTPGVDADFVEFMWSTPVQQRQHDRLYAQLLLCYHAPLAGPEVLTAEHRARIEQIAQTGLVRARRSSQVLRSWAKGLGLAPYARQVQARLGRIEQTKADMMPPAVVIQTLRTTGFDRPIYRRPQIEQALARAERGSVYWLHALMPVFYMELWHSLGDPAALAALRQAVFVE